MVKKNDFKAPYWIIILDLTDAFAYADVFDDERYKVLGNDFIDEIKSVALANRLFTALNPGIKTRKEWEDAGNCWDVRVYDNNYKDVYRAHSKLLA